MADQIDRAKLDVAIRWMKDAEWGSPKTTEACALLCVAAEAHLATLPKTKMVEVGLIARMSADGKDVHYCRPDSPENRHEAGRLVLLYGGQLVTLKGMAEVAA